MWVKHRDSDRMTYLPFIEHSYSHFEKLRVFNIHRRAPSVEDVVKWYVCEDVGLKIGVGVWRLFYGRSPSQTEYREQRRGTVQCRARPGSGDGPAKVRGVEHNHNKFRSLTIWTEMKENNHLNTSLVDFKSCLSPSPPPVYMTCYVSGINRMAAAIHPG